MAPRWCSVSTRRFYYYDRSGRKQQLDHSGVSALGAHVMYLLRRIPIAGAPEAAIDRSIALIAWLLEEET